MQVYLLILINVILLVTGQILWKLGLEGIGNLTADNWPRVLTSLPIWGGVLLYAAATGIWLVVLSKARLSLAYPLQSLAYVLGMLAGLIIFRESVPPLSWLGAGMIMAGIFLIGVWR